MQSADNSNTPTPERSNTPDLENQLPVEANDNNDIESLAVSIKATVDNEPKNTDDISNNNVTANGKKDWMSELSDFDPSDSSITGVIRQQPRSISTTQDPIVPKPIPSYEMSSVEFHKTEFLKICDKDNNITLEKLYDLIDAFKLSKDPLNSIHNMNIIGNLQDGYFQDYINQLGDSINLIDYLAIVKHFERNYGLYGKDFLRLSQDTINYRVEQQKEAIKVENTSNQLRIKQEVSRIHNDIKVDNSLSELEHARRIKNIQDAKKLVDYDENIQLYSQNSYNNTCCKSISNLSNQNVIDNFDRIYEIITSLPSLTKYEKNLILTRFFTILTYCTKNYNTVSKLYNSTQIFLIACSIVNPALLSINSDKNNVHYDNIFWTVWISQLLVSLITGYIGLFKWDKKYYLFNAYKTKINQEIWLYIGLTGKHYKHYDSNYNHAMHLHTFLNRLEELYRRLKCSEFEIESTNDEEKDNNSSPNPPPPHDPSYRGGANILESGQPIAAVSPVRR